jgi:two-component system, cell cycle sensor histidine kinase and response regulator CckA
VRISTCSGNPARNLRPVKVDPSQIDQILANLCVNARDAIAGVGKITIETDAKTFDEAYCADHLGFSLENMSCLR